MEYGIVTLVSVGMTPLACGLVGLRRAKDAREDIIMKKADHVIAMSMAALNTTSSSSLDIGESKESIEMISRGGTATSLPASSLNNANELQSPRELPGLRPELMSQLSRVDTEVSAKFAYCQTRMSLWRFTGCELCCQSLCLRDHRGCSVACRCRHSNGGHVFWKFLV